MRQLAIDLPYSTAWGRADFLVSASNRAAFDWIERWPDWPGKRLLLYGPEGCGKSHLARLWSVESGGRYIAGSTLASGELPVSNGAIPPGASLRFRSATPAERMKKARR